jgi:hypothetical protein
MTNTDYIEERTDMEHISEQRKEKVRMIYESRNKKKEKETEQNIKYQTGINKCETAYIEHLKNKINNSPYKQLALHNNLSISERDPQKWKFNKAEDMNIVRLSNEVNSLQKSLTAIYQQFSSDVDKMISNGRSKFQSASDNDDLTLAFKETNNLYCSVGFDTEDPDTISGTNAIPVLMFLLNNFIKKSDPAGIEKPKLKISLTKNTSESVLQAKYILSAFKLKEGSEEIPLNSKNLSKYSEAVKEFLVEYKKDLHKIMEYYSSDCNNIKNADSEQITLACRNASFPGSTDFMTKMLVCHQIAAMSSDDSLCPVETLGDVVFDI